MDFIRTISQDFPEEHKDKLSTFMDQTNESLLKITGDIKSLEQEFQTTGQTTITLPDYLNEFLNTIK